MAVSHADLAPRRKGTYLGSKTGAFLMVFSILCGLLCFILCLFAEATRSEVTWEASNHEGKKEKYKCVYNGSGKTPLLCAAGGFLVLAVAMMVEHTYMLIAVSKTPAPAWDVDTGTSKTLTWLAGVFFVATWVCFAVGEILLLIGLSVESGHLTKWNSPSPSCLIVRQGVFASAGVFGLITVFFAAGLYLTALRMQRLSEDQENVRQQVLEASVLYASPPRSPPHRHQVIRSIGNENPVMKENFNERTLSEYTLVLSKQF